MKKIGIISDTHIPSRQSKLPKKVYTTFKEVDLILHAGDFESISVAEALENIAPLKAVSGNMCWPEIRERFPPSQIIEIESLVIGLTHGNGGPQGYLSRVKQTFGEDEPDIIISGHTHVPNAEIIDNVLFLNPGSPTDKRFAKTNSILVLTIDKDSYEYKFIQVSPTNVKSVAAHLMGLSRKSVPFENTKGLSLWCRRPACRGWVGFDDSGLFRGG